MSTHNQITSLDHFSNSINIKVSFMKLVPDDGTTDKKANVGMIVAGLIVLAILLIKKKLNIPNIDGYLETLDDGATYLKNSNPI